MQTTSSKPVAVITGGTSGIGRALAEKYRHEGFQVAVCARKQPALEALKNELNAPDLFTQVADVSIEADCKSFIDAVYSQFGRIDILINNAGISMRALFKDADVSVLKSLMDINFWGTVYCTKFAMPALLASKGTVVGVSSIAGYRGLPGRTGYSASKFAMQGFLEALRTENLRTGVNVMWVCPGFTASNIRNTALNQHGTAQSETPLDEGKLMTSEAVATEIFKAVSKRKRTLVLTGQGKLTVWLNKLIPGIADGLVFNHFKKEPGSPLQ